MLNDMPKRLLRSSESTEVDVREDEEQTTKFQEIIDLLVAAGYFRARIKGLTNFDKVVGGMTWCIESCNFDVDVDLLFQENLTIGQKISLTEKIVVMLPKMNCPYRIEPHQIQGLDCIHIFPVIQWLVKRSMEMRQEMADFVRAFALNQFHKKHSFSEDSESGATANENIIRNLRSVKKAYEPRRLFKQKEDFVKDESSRFIGTVLEYEAPFEAVKNTTMTAAESKSSDSRNESSNEKNEKDTTEQITAALSVIEENSMRLSVNTLGNIVGIQAQEIAKVAEKYATMATSEIGDGDATDSSRALIALQKQKTTLQSRVRKLTKERDSLSDKLTEIVEKVKEYRARKETIERSFKKIREIGINDNDSIFKRLEELLSVHEGLKEQEHNFREQCKSDLNLLRGMVQEIENGAPVEEEDRVKEYEEQKEAITRVRLQLAKKNRIIASLTRQLDDVPGRSELTQYQRRFMELYNQVSAKHKETKQYYTLYNTLDDTKLYISKELSLLNSIQDNYNEAMASTSGKEQFLKQFETIVAGVKRNKTMVEKRCADEKGRRDTLSRQLVTLVEQQRKYVAAVRQLTIECRKNEALLAQLRGP
ncbi:PREDICTED: coiled-coil domain-containing protein 93 [Wasmannia auropunctata]|uniref:coiled-coil domain-containing protein 93 n=1 Tax=Wasmannia auropunctata TaxID=64793 RepID=UPI0005EE6541|nr:PREDICTED: coiled-coil domain-containing protein 93 [Wasmannia auropunctata]XP_011696544.1 PREDICTED: coiled-coil domain-containing protein 93 [Wasmannia auropunctata]